MKQEEIDGFIKGEQIGREAFQAFMDQVKPGTEIIFNEERYDAYDASYDGMEVEIKVRENYVNGFDTLVMNEEKLKRMVQMINEKKFSRGIYFNFIKNADGKIDKAYGWTIHQICQGLQDGSYQWDMKYAPRTTAADNGMVWKKQLMLPKDRAFYYELDEQSGKWVKMHNGK